MSESKVDWSPLCDIVHGAQSFTLSSHVRPDADAVGSELAMAMGLRSLGKSVRIINPSALGGHLAFLDPNQEAGSLADEDSEEGLFNVDVCMVLDTSSWSQLNRVGKLLRKSSGRRVVIDHHVSSDDMGAEIFKDTTSAATGELVFECLQALGVTITPEIAVALYCAIATDTGWFRFSSTTGRTMRIVGQLIDAGARPQQIYENLYEQNSAARMQLMSRSLARITLAEGGRLAYTTVLWKDFEETGAHPSDTEDFVNLCLTIAGTKVAFMAVEQQNGQTKISLRSRMGLDVAKIAEKFGGGGHRQASGTVLSGPLVAARERILTAICEELAAVDSAAE